MRSSSSAATARSAIAHQFCKGGIPLVGVPKTIDNDIVGTTNCFGFDTAVSFATDAIDRLHTTAEAHRRILVVEVMGRYAGWIALWAGVAGGADAILIPEIPFDICLVAERLRERDKWGAKFSIVVVAEGAFPKGGIPVAHRGGARRAPRAPRRHRRESLRRAGTGDGEADAVGRARPPAAGRRADQLRSRARDAVRRQGGGVDPTRSVRRDGGLRSAGYRAAAARGGRREGRRPCRWTRTCC